MKKTLVSALTTALVVGAASTTFAAANPFSDVPADHWAYDAVAQLAADGVIEGYGDASFQGQKNITRYEMAQMVAKAMAKAPQGSNDKALIDRLAAEFADELNNLGVRVANLERNADMVKWNGTAEYTFQNTHVEAEGHENTNNVLFRLEPSAEVNSHWHVNARLDAYAELKDDTTENVKLKRVWAQGDYDNFSVKLGKFAPIDDDTVVDTTFSGAEASFGSQLKFTVGGGRLNNVTLDDQGAIDEVAYGTIDANSTDITGNYQYAGLDYSIGKFDLGAHYHHVNFDSFAYKTNSGKTDEFNLWKVNAGYNFDGNWALAGYYGENHDADDYDTIGAVELNYKGAEAENKGSWGAWVAYRHLGQNAVLASTYDVTDAGLKGWEVGADYTLFKNVVLTGRYGWNKDLVTDKSVDSVFGRVNFYF